ncbi:cytochrome P450 2D15-like [Ptychodera flava]|uniref:cytochrome P450 2D15-like n=1 Tax=Ptychodera flava TaxID=63121 RepID=UPI003969C866
MYGFSFDLSTVLVFLTTFLFSLLCVHSRSESERGSKRHEKMPPGPRGLPVFGNLLSLGTNPHLTFVEMAKQFGSVFTIRIGSEPIVVLNGYKAVKDTLIAKSLLFAGRPKMPLTEELTKGKGIVTADYGDTWKTQRKFTLKTLKEYGMGRPAMEKNITKEMECLTKAFSEKKLQPFEVDKYLQVSIANIVCSVTFGSRYEYGDPQLLTLLHLIDRFCEIGPASTMVNFFPFLKHVPFGPVKEVFTNNEIMTQYVNSVIRQHGETIDYNRLRDFIDAYMDEIRKQNNNDTNKETSFNEEYLFYLLNDLFFAGTETMSVTLRWGLLYMIAFPDIQKKVQDEIDAVVGADRLPSLADKPHLPYTEAAMLEIQRMANITALTFPHKTLDDVQLYDHVIPKDTTVFVNLYSVHVDETQFPEPDKFDPGRFLNENGRVKQNPALLAFSAGRRRCPGEELATSELFLFFTGLLQRFSFQNPPGSPQPTLEKVFGISLVPHPYKVVAVPRSGDIPAH